MLINPRALQCKDAPEKQKAYNYVVVYGWHISKSLHTYGCRSAVVPKVFKLLTLLTI